MKYILSFLFGFDRTLFKIDKGNLGIVLSFTLFYLFLLSLSLYAFFHAMYLVTDNLYISVLISLFFSFLLHNMYRLILATSLKGNGLKSKRQLFTYISVKGFLIIVLSIFISKSICTDVFESDIKSELHKHKADIISKYKKNLDANFAYEIEDLKKSYEDEKVFNRLMGQANNIEDEVMLKTELTRIEEKKQNKMNVVNASVKKSNFFMKKLRIVSSKAKHWFFTLISIIFFLIPLYIYNSSSFFLSYQNSLLDNNRTLILSEYNGYKSTFVKLLSAKSGKQISINERYEDPPFNTIRKTSSVEVLKKGSLLEWLKKYHG